MTEDTPWNVNSQQESRRCVAKADTNRQDNSCAGFTSPMPANGNIDHDRHSHHLARLNPTALCETHQNLTCRTVLKQGMEAQVEKHIGSVEHQSRKQGEQTFFMSPRAVISKLVVDSFCLLMRSVQEKFNSPTEHHLPITAMTRVSSEAHSAHSAAPMAKAATEIATKSFKNITGE